MLNYRTKREIIQARKDSARLKSDGWEEVDEYGALLWELNQGCLMGQQITDVCIDPRKKSLWVKIGDPKK